jgi:hypothetical protein
LSLILIPSSLVTGHKTCHTRCLAQRRTYQVQHRSSLTVVQISQIFISFAIDRDITATLFGQTSCHY